MTAQPLKPCPFCGSPADYGWSFGAEWVECTRCDAEISADTFAEAAAAWNQRADPKHRPGAPVNCPACMGSSAQGGNSNGS